MRFGLHVRVAGGYVKAVEHAKLAGCTAMQIFSSNPRGYRTSPIDRVALEAFARLRARRRSGSVRDSHAVPDQPRERRRQDRPRVAPAAAKRFSRRRGGRDALCQYASRFVWRRATAKKRLPRSAARWKPRLSAIEPGVFLVLENSAGAGKLMGGTLEELGALARSVAHPQLGICLDTAHAWASGYEINSKDGVDRFLEQAEREIGLDRILMFHFNDTQVPLGASRDRHWHIGEGLIGFEGFRALLAHPELRGQPAILETPGSDEDDRRNMQTILAIARGAGL